MLLSQEFKMLAGSVEEGLQPVTVGWHVNVSLGRARKVHL